MRRGGIEEGLQAPSADIYQHEMPGGQFTNLRQQARNLGLGGRWTEVCRAYAEANQLVGDIVKVTPTSKVVGDMALFMVANNLTSDDVLDANRELAYPESVVEMMAGRLGQPPGGFPRRLRDRVLRGEKPMRGRPGAKLPPADFVAAAAEVQKVLDRPPEDREVVSYLLYPRVFPDLVAHQTKYSDTSVLPTPVFFFGMEPGEEISVDIEPGKTLFIKYITVGGPHPDGTRTVFFELNGQPRSVRVADESAQATSPRRSSAVINGRPFSVDLPWPDGWAISSRRFPKCPHRRRMVRASNKR